MTVHPSIQAQAQAEVDRVLGHEHRLPTLADRSRLPFVDCIVWECLRWNPSTPVALPHYVSEDDEYRGWRIPKGALVMANTWYNVSSASCFKGSNSLNRGILHDPAVYPDPLSFNPSRFLDQEANAKKGVNPLPDAAFGFGRRMCPGRNIAFETIWLTVACVLSVYNLAREIGPDGEPIEPDLRYISSLLRCVIPFPLLSCGIETEEYSRPKPFKCKITPRSEKAAALVPQTETTDN